MDSGFLSGTLALLSLPCHSAAFFRAATLLHLKASHLDPSRFSTCGPSAFAARPESLWEALSCPLPQLLGVAHSSGPFRRKAAVSHLTVCRTPCEKTTAKRSTDPALLPTARGMVPGKGPRADPHGGAMISGDGSWSTGTATTL